MFQVLGSCSQPLSLQDTQLIKVPPSDFSCAEDAAAGTSPWVYAGLALIRNKLWHYNEHLEVNGARRAFFDEGGITYDVCKGE